MSQRVCVQGRQHMYCADISAGMEAFPVAAIIDNPAALRASGVGPPPIFPSHFMYCTRPAALPMTPAARQLLDELYPASSSKGFKLDMWDGCQRTQGVSRTGGDAGKGSSRV